MQIQLLKLQKLVNHVAFVLDHSSSMQGKLQNLELAFDAQINYLKIRSQELNQETRISVYIFDHQVECMVFDMDVMRMPSLKNTIQIGGATALQYATKVAIEDLNLLPQKYGDHAFLTYALTDGEENQSFSTHRLDTPTFKKFLGNLSDNHTVACLVPDARGISEAKSFGFPAGNVKVWETSAEGIAEMGKVTRSAMDTWMDNRTKGIRGSNTMFSDLSSVTPSNIKKVLTELDANKYSIIAVRRTKDAVIQPFVELWTKKPYVVGSVYYELVKTEREVQASKNICVQNRKNGKVYEGDSARDLLKLPTHTVRLKPGDHGDWRIFIQSTSINRKLPQDSYILVMK